MNGDGVVCLDLDGCLEGGVVADWARPVLARLPATYVEVSPSGTGLHVFGLGRVDRGRHFRVGPGRVEVYGWGRFICVTGLRFAGAPARLADVSEAIASLE